MDTSMLPAIDRNGYQLGLSLLIAACGDKIRYDAADYARAGLPVVVSCTRCTGAVTGGAARLYRAREGYAAFCGTCS